MRTLLCTSIAVLAAACEGTIFAPAVDPADARRAQDPTLESWAETFFPGGAEQEPRKRLFRLTRSQLDATALWLLPAHVGTSVGARVPRDPLQTNYEYADNLAFNDANFPPYTDWVSQIAESVKASPASVINCGTDACRAEAARAFVRKAFRNIAPDATLDAFADFYTRSAADAGVPWATADLVDVTLTSPRFVFRDEVQVGQSDALLPPQQAQAIAYTLADVPPAALGLTGQETAQEAVDLALASPEARAKLTRFFNAWVEVRAPEEFTLAPSVYPDFTPELVAAALDETRQFLSHQLSKARPTLKDVTQSTESFASGPLEALYGPDAAQQRLGLFTQASVIASHSGPTTTRLVKRGVFFVRKVMCVDLGAPPPDVNRDMPAAESGTLRQFIETATAAPRCQGCHGYINPFGFALENYEATGRWRTTDNALPVDPNVHFGFLEEGPLDAHGPVEALKRITGSMRFQQCFVRQLFRYYLGRDETPADAPLLRQVFFDFAKDDEQDLLKALRTLGSSSRFVQRGEAL